MRERGSGLLVTGGLVGSVVLAIAAFGHGSTALHVPLHLSDRMAWVRPHQLAFNLTGVSLLGLCWLLLDPSRHPGRRVPWRRVLVLWSLPLLLVPPVMSSDPSPYADVGWMLLHHRNPYTTGMGFSGALFPVDHIWRNTITPYPPLGLEVQAGVVRLFHADPYWAVVGMRLPALAGLALVVVLLPRIAAHLGRPPQRALWLGTLNPLVVVHGVGGAHNDMLMTGLLVLAVWLALHRGGLWWGSVLVGLSGSIKQVGLAGVLMVAGLALQRWQQRRGDVPGGDGSPGGATVPWQPDAVVRRGPFGRWLVLLAISTLIAVGTFVAVTLATGLGFGWRRSPGPLASVTPTPAHLASGAWQWAFGVQPPMTPQHLDVVFRQVMLVLVLLSVVLECWRRGRDQPVRGTGVVLFAWAMGYGVMWAWYLLAPLALMGISRWSRLEERAIEWLVLFLLGVDALWMTRWRLHDRTLVGLAVATGVLVVATLLGGRREVNRSSAT